ncbi:hypothetical protein D3C75_1255420 [compost metagenome]
MTPVRNTLRAGTEGRVFAAPAVLAAPVIAVLAAVSAAAPPPAGVPAVPEFVLPAVAEPYRTLRD